MTDKNLSNNANTKKSLKTKMAKSPFYLQEHFDSFFPHTAWFPVCEWARGELSGNKAYETSRNSNESKSYRLITVNMFVVETKKLTLTAISL